MEIVPRVLKKVIIIANPIADSEAATVKINKANNSPKISSKYNEKNIKFKLIDNNINSIEISINIRLCLLIIIPNNPRLKRKKLKKK